MKHLKAQIISKFQHTAARRRLAADPIKIAASLMVSTHSRPKAAGSETMPTAERVCVSTHSRPKAAGRLSKFRNSV